MITKRILVIIVAGLIVAAAVNCQPTTYSITVTRISQSDSGLYTLIASGGKILTYAGAPLLIEFTASGFECPNQDISFKISYLYRRVRPANFLEDPSSYIMEGYMTTTTITSETCNGSWTSPQLRDGIHTIGILAFDGSGAQSSWYHLTVIKNNDRGGTPSQFPGGDQEPATEGEEPPVSTEPVVIIDTPGQTLSANKDPVQYVDINFHTDYPFAVEYFSVGWTFASSTGCTYSSTSIVYPTEFNRGVFRLDMSSVFATDWDAPTEGYGKCKFGPGQFLISVSCKTVQGKLGAASTVTIQLA